MNLARVLHEVNFLIWSTYELQLKLQGDGLLLEQIETIIINVLGAGCRIIHTHRTDNQNNYHQSELPYVEMLLKSVCESYDVICERILDEAATQALASVQFHQQNIIMFEELEKLNETVTAIYKK